MDEQLSKLKETLRQRIAEYAELDRQHQALQKQISQARAAHKTVGEAITQILYEEDLPEEGAVQVGDAIYFYQVDFETESSDYQNPVTSFRKVDLL